MPNIHEGNLLIARFITDEPEVLEHDLKKAGTLESMAYHNDWNWIMPVVEKIENCFDGCVNVEINGENCLIHNIEPQFKRFVAGKTKIQAIWLAVVEFITWYNKQNA